MGRRITRACCLIFLIAAVPLAGCSYKRLTVVDIHGDPIKRAEVVVKSASLDGERTLTDDQGSTTVKDPPAQVPTSISIHKDGVGSTMIAYPGRWPVKVTLRPSSP